MFAWGMVVGYLIAVLVVVAVQFWDEWVSPLLSQNDDTLNP
jgi:hypothetical protein